MKRRRFWVTLGVIVLCVLLLWWLYAAILINEDEAESIPPVMEQSLTE